MRIRTRDRSRQDHSYQDRSRQDHSRHMDAPLWSEIDADHVVLDLYGGCLPLELTAAGLGPLGQCDHLDVPPDSPCVERQNEC